MAQQYLTGIGIEIRHAEWRLQQVAKLSNSYRAVELLIETTLRLFPPADQEFHSRHQATMYVAF